MLIICRKTSMVQMLMLEFRLIASGLVLIAQERPLVVPVAGHMTQDSMGWVR